MPYKKQTTIVIMWVNNNILQLIALLFCSSKSVVLALAREQCSLQFVTQMF